MVDKVDELIIDFVTQQNGKSDYYAGRNIAAEMEAIARGEEKVATKAEKAKNKTSSLSKEIKNTTTQAQLLSRALKWVGGYLAVGKLKEYADEWIKIKSTLGLLTNGDEERIALQEKIRDIANDTYSSMSGTVDLYSKLTTNAKSLNMDEEKRLKLTETINKALAVGGGDAQSNKSVMLQFGQALGIGKFQGQDLKSIMQNNIGFAQTIAEGLGVDVGQLTEMGAKGELTSEKVVNALLKQADDINKKFEKMPQTMSQSLTVLNNNFGNFINNLNETTGFTESLAKGINLVAKAFDLLAKHTKIVSALIGGVMIKRLMDMRRVFLETRAPIGTLTNSFQMLISGEIKNGILAIANSLKLMISPQIINGLKAVGVAGWKMAAPFLKLAIYIYAIRLFLKLCKELFNLFTGKENIFEDFWLMVFENMPDIKAWFKDRVIDPLVQFGKDFAEVAEYPFKKLWDAILAIGEKIGEWIADIYVMIRDGISEAWDSAKNSVKGWFGFGSDDKENTSNTAIKHKSSSFSGDIGQFPKYPEFTIPQIPQAPIPINTTGNNQAYTDNKTINVTINEAKDGQASYSRLMRIVDDSSAQSSFRQATGGLGFSYAK